MSDTPETDAAKFEVREQWNPIPIEVVPAATSEHLERERDEARRERDELLEKYKIHHKEAERLTREITETKRELDKWEKSGVEFARERERDDAIATIRDVLSALGAFRYEGPRLAAMRVRAERDEARVSLSKCEEFCRAKDSDIDRILDERDEARRERDEAIAKVGRQAERVRYLEGATNHVNGTPLSIAIRERDEARRERDYFKTVAGELISMIRVNVMRDTFRDSTIEQVDEHLKPWVEKLQKPYNHDQTSKSDD